jgi:DNA mismatch repair ATPase MutS
VAEALAATGARTLLATHFTELAELANIYPQCRAWHFSVNTSNNTLDYTFELQPGRCKDKHYGLALAAAVAFPQEALERAKTVVEGEILVIKLFCDLIHLSLLFSIECTLFITSFR